VDVFVAAALADLHEQLEPYYSEIGRPSVDPELMIRMLIVGYCYGIRSGRRLCEEVDLHLAMGAAFGAPPPIAIGIRALATALSPSHRRAGKVHKGAAADRAGRPAF
jgi:hypothetical protein